MKEIGILGTGRMAIRLADMFAKAGVKVQLGSRTPQRAKNIALALKHENIVGGTYEEALAKDWFLPAIFLRDGLLDLLEENRALLEGKVLLDIANPFNDTYSDFTSSWDTSASEDIAKILPNVKIIGAFKNVWYEVFDEPFFEEGISDVYMISEHDELKKELAETLKETNFRYVDAGKLQNARTIERMTLLATELSLRYKYFPRVNWKFLGTEWTIGEKDKYAEILEKA